MEGKINNISRHVPFVGSHMKVCMDMQLLLGNLHENTLQVIYSNTNFGFLEAWLLEAWLLKYLKLFGYCWDIQMKFFAYPSIKGLTYIYEWVYVSELEIYPM